MFETAMLVAKQLADTSGYPSIPLPATLGIAVPFIGMVLYFIYWLMKQNETLQTKSGEKDGVLLETLKDVAVSSNTAANSLDRLSASVEKQSEASQNILLELRDLRGRPYK